MTLAERMKTVAVIRDLTVNEKTVLFCLAVHANQNTMEAWPALMTLCEESCQGLKGVRSAIEGLESKGYLQIVSKGSGRRSTVYRLLLTQEFGETTSRRKDTPEVSLGTPQPYPHGHPRGIPTDTPALSLGTPEQVIEQSNEQGAVAPRSVWSQWERIAGTEARSELGHLIATHGESCVEAAVRAVVLKQPADPVSYLYGVLRNSRSARHPKKVVL